MFRFMGKDKKGKKEKENSKPSSDKNLPPDMTPEERKEAEKLPFGGNTKLSKSKSGRYKVKNKQRCALDGEIYATGASYTKTSSSAAASSSQQQQPGGATGGSSSRAAQGSSSYTSSNSQQQSSSSSYGGGGSQQQQGSLGRTSGGAGGHCGAANAVTKRYSGATAGISSQPTAV